MLALHAQQHPSAASCTTRRLLLTQFDAKSFEGIGSLLKQVMLGLAEAAYANRTLVWGLDMGYMFERSREVWQGQDGGGGSVPAGDLLVDCSGWRGAGGGPYACFFRPLSSCSLLNVSGPELAALGRAGHDDAARVRVQESRRGPVAYVPPPGRFRPAALPAASSPAARGMGGGGRGNGMVGEAWASARRAWAASLAAYTFRLKPDVLATFRARRDALGLAPGGGLHRRPRKGGNAAGGGSEAGDTATPSSSGGGSGGVGGGGGGSLWAMHVRHGDVSVLEDVYGNRRVFPFRAYFDALWGEEAARANGSNPNLAAKPRRGVTPIICCGHKNSFNFHTWIKNAP